MASLGARVLRISSTCSFSHLGLGCVYGGGYIVVLKVARVAVVLLADGGFERHGVLCRQSSVVRLPFLR